MMPTMWPVSKVQGNPWDGVMSFLMEVAFEGAPGWQAGASGDWAMPDLLLYLSALPALMWNSRFKIINYLLLFSGRTTLLPVSMSLFIWSSFPGMVPYQLSLGSTLLWEVFSDSSDPSKKESQMLASSECLQSSTHHWVSWTSRQLRTFLSYPHKRWIQ